MDEIHCTQDLKDALRRLRKLADRLIADRLQKKKFEHIGTLTHIFRVLGVAADRDRLPSAYLDELVSLCRWPWLTSKPIDPCRDNSARIYSSAHDHQSYLCGRTVEDEAWKGFMEYARSASEDQQSLGYFKPTNSTILVPVTSIEDPENEWTDNIEFDWLTDLPDCVSRDLYVALKHYARCKCPRTDEDDGKEEAHEGKMRLLGRSPVDDDPTVFDFHFLSCPTVSATSGSAHWQQLRLNSRSKRTASKHVQFANKNPQGASHWKSARIQLEPEHESAVHANHGSCLSEEGFCQLLRVPNGGAVICLQIEEERLRVLPGRDDPEQELANSLSTPLVEVLTSYTLSNRMKLTLGYILARSMWQHYHSNWTGISWSPQTIQFMPGTKPTVAGFSSITCRPCFAFQFNDTNEVVPEYCEHPDAIHRFLRILSLGILLVKIGGDDQPTVLHQSENNKFDIVRINKDYVRGRRTAENSDWPATDHSGNSTVTMEHYRAATKACLNAQLFYPTCDRCKSKRITCKGSVTAICRGCLIAGKKICSYNTHPRSSPEALKSGAVARRDLLFARVVKPLHDALVTAGWKDAILHPEDIPLKSERTAQRDRFYQPQDSSEDGKSTTPNSTTRPEPRCQFCEVEKSRHDVHLKVDTDTLRIKCEDYKAWKKSFTETARHYMDPLEEHHRVKIAILDTGLNTKHGDIEGSLDRIWVYEDNPIKSNASDWTMSKDDGAYNTSEATLGTYKRCKMNSIVDEEGHGTHIAGLVLEYAPDAHLYVANVANEGKADSELLARAIRSAADSGVDIISISIGFDRTPPDTLGDAIAYAQQKKDVLIFACASNNGGNGFRTWPANYHNVFCIHSTDHYGNKSLFNPTERLPDDFSTIGEAVVSLWPDDLPGGTLDGDMNTIAKSGTSFSTPIAACIAGFLLRYARTHLRPKEQMRLKRPHVMRALMKRLTRDLKRDDCHYLTLRSGAGHLFESTNTAEEIKASVGKIINDTWQGSRQY